MKSRSFVQKFMFSKLPIRGAFVVLDNVWQDILSQKVYPDSIAQVLGELLAVNILLTTGIKFDGKIITQIQDNSVFDLIVSECKHDLSVRATAKFAKDIDTELSYQKCLSAGRLVVSIDTESEGKIYQSVIGLDGGDIATIINRYMQQSEQLNSIFVLAYNKNKVVGFVLQQLPSQDVELLNDIERIFFLANTLSKKELLKEASATLLHYLFSEDDIVLFDDLPVSTFCNCSRVKVAKILSSLGMCEVERIIEEDGEVEVFCEFCNTRYAFVAEDLPEIFTVTEINLAKCSDEIH